MEMIVDAAEEPLRRLRRSMGASAVAAGSAASRVLTRRMTAPCVVPQPRALTGSAALSSASVLRRRMDGPILWRAVQRRTATASGRLAALHSPCCSLFSLALLQLASVC